MATHWACVGPRGDVDPGAGRGERLEGFQGDQPTSPTPSHAPPAHTTGTSAAVH